MCRLLRCIGAALLALAVGACAGPGADPSPSPSETVPASPTVAPASVPSASPTSIPLRSPDDTPSASPNETLVVVDAALLDHLPATVDGSTLTPDPATARSIARDPTLATEASGIAVALATSTSGSADDFAISSVVQLRPGIYSDRFFAKWRSSYDTAACAQAGGVGGSGQRTIAGRHVFIGDCSSGAFTYHVHLAGGVLVSVTSVGPDDLGALVMAGLR